MPPTTPNDNRATSPATRTINERVARELDLIPRGERGSDQNMLRALYQMIRSHSLGERSTDRWTAEECLAKAIETIRERSPHFEPTLIDRRAHENFR